MEVSKDIREQLDSTGSVNTSLEEDSLVAAAAAAESHYNEEDSIEEKENLEEGEKDKDSDYQAKSSDNEEEGGSDDGEKPGTSSEVQSPASNGSDGSDSDIPVRSKRSRREEQRKLMEAAGVLRKSGRQRKEVERFEIKDSSDQEKRGRRNRGKGGSRNSGSENSEDSDGASSEGSDYGSSRKKRSKPRSGKRKAKKSRRRRRDSSGDEWSSSSGEPKRTVRAGARDQKVDYRESSSDGAVDEDDVLEWNEEPEATDGAEQVETIEKILKHRVGRFGATGHGTTRYNVEDRGDPNEGFQPDMDTPQTHYFIKWLNWSHVHNTWEAEETLRKNKVKGLKKLENYIGKAREVDDWKASVDKDSVEYYDCEQEMAEQLYEQHMTPERIIAESKEEEKEDGGMEYLVKWRGLPYADSTWEDESLVKRWAQDKIDAFEQRSRSQKIPTKLSRALRQRPKFKPFKEQPEFLAEGKSDMILRDYQLDGLNWLLRAWCKTNSCILADEMGLGKTIQSISFLSALANEHDLYGPFLVVVPLSTLAAWQKEFFQWAPDLNVIVYIGDVRSRDMIRNHEWYLPASRRLKFNCCLTTYEILLKDKMFLGGVEWAGLMVDEAHRLKNDESLLYRSLFEFSTDHRVLVTGTPLQNSLKELWALLHFIMPNLFESWEDFEERHKSSEKMAYQTLHQELEPFLLRRVKKDVEKSLPAKVEQILRVDMTVLQKQYYKWILTKNYSALSKGVKGSISGFLNIVMELKKCCNHAYLTRPPEVEPSDAQQRLQGLKKASGKLILLDKLLCQLKETGHRVLIFSQMVMLLDILQEYLQLKKFTYQRLDGTMRGELRKQALEHFNQEGSTDFCFLLSTKAGGLGINLATADTVIIFDSDWNPQNDLQAQSRAHRIGQKRQVNIYRLVTKGTVEEDIVERAKQKLVLDHLVIQRMDTTGRTVLSKKGSGSSATPFNKDELSSILKFGAEELFKEEEGDEQDPEVDIEEIMQRAETRETEPSNKQADDLLSAFKVTNFAYDEKTEVGPGPRWEDIIPEAERERIAEEERKVVLNPLAPRSRRKVHDPHSDENDEEWDPNSKKRKRNEERDSSDSDDDDKPTRGGKRQKTAIFNFSEPEVKRFLRSYKKFARVNKRLEAIAGDADLEDKSVKELEELCDALDRSFKQAVTKYNLAQQKQDTQTEKKDKGPVFKFGGVEVNLKTLLRPQVDLEPLYQIMPSSPESRKHFSLATTPRSVKSWDVEWGVEEDCALLRGIYEYGLGSWEAIKMDPQLLLTDKILLPDKIKKPQGKHLLSRSDYLLKLIRKQELPSGGDDLVIPGMDPDVAAILMEKPVRKVIRRAPVATAAKPEKGTEQKEEPSTAAVPKRKPRAKTTKTPEGEENKSRHKPKPEEEKKTVEKGLNTENLDVKEKFSHDLDKQNGKIFKLCVGKMKKVQKFIKKMKQADAPSDFNQSLLKIGDHIQESLSDESIKEKDLEKWHSYYWLFVGKFFSNLNGPTLCKFYRNMKKPAEKTSKIDQSDETSKSQKHHSGPHRHDHSHDHRRPHKSSGRDSSWDRSRYEEPRYQKNTGRSSYNQAPNSHSRYGQGRGEENSNSPPSRYQR